MIIHPVQRMINDAGITLSANIVWEKSSPDQPQSLWYNFSNQYKDVLADNSDGFLITMLPTAMFYNENIHVQGSVSESLLYSIDKYQQILNFWHPEFFSLVSVTADTILPTKNSIKTGTMCTYTGGVDSSYTLWSHLAENEKDVNFNITHALYIADFGLQEETQETIAKKVEVFSELIRSLNIDFVITKTNAKLFQQFGYETPMYLADPSLILAPVAFFTNVIQNFLFSSDATHDYEILEVAGHTTVPLLASAGMNVRVFGGSVSRLEKLTSLAKWPAIHDRLVSCWKNPDGINNCGVCNKCSYTMAAIQMQGLTGVFKTFPPKINRSLVRSFRADKGVTYIYWKWIYFAIQRKQWSIAMDYTWALGVSRLHILLADLGLSSLRNPVSIVYIISAALRKRSTKYSQAVDRIKKVKGVKI